MFIPSQNADSVEAIHAADLVRPSHGRLAPRAQSTDSLQDPGQLSHYELHELFRSFRHQTDRQATSWKFSAEHAFEGAEQGKAS